LENTFFVWPILGNPDTIGTICAQDPATVDCQPATRSGHRELPTGDKIRPPWIDKPATRTGDRGLTNRRQEPVTVD